MRKLTDIIKVKHELLPVGFQREKTLQKVSKASVQEETTLTRTLVKGGRAYRKRERERKESVDLSIERAQHRKKQQSKYYKKNKAKLNGERAVRNQLPEYIYAKAKQRAREKDIEWDFTLDTWMGKWFDAPTIWDETSGFLVTAWSKRGPIYNRDAQLVRIDTALGWNPDNTHVVFKGEAIPEEIVA